MIEVNHISKRYGKKQVLNGITFQAAKGQCIGIVGNNGCGKSTLLAILSGALHADNGMIAYDGHMACGHPKIFSQYIGYVPQENPLIDELSVKDNLRLWYANSKGNLETDLRDGLPAMMGLTKELSTQAGKLSGGMKKRLSIVCALSAHPPILILDEPSAALDLVCKEEIRNYIREYLATGGTIILTTHDESELPLCSNLYVMKQGILKEIKPDILPQALTQLIRT